MKFNHVPSKHIIEFTANLDEKELFKSIDNVYPGELLSFKLEQPFEDQPNHYQFSDFSPKFNEKFTTFASCDFMRMIFENKLGFNCIKLILIQNNQETLITKASIFHNYSRQDIENYNFFIETWKNTNLAGSTLYQNKSQPLILNQNTKKIYENHTLTVLQEYSGKIDCKLRFMTKISFNSLNKYLSILFPDLDTYKLENVGKRSYVLYDTTESFINIQSFPTYLFIRIVCENKFNFKAQDFGLMTSTKNRWKWLSKYFSSIFQGDDEEYLKFLEQWQEICIETKKEITYSSITPNKMTYTSNSIPDLLDLSSMDPAQIFNIPNLEKIISDSGKHVKYIVLPTLKKVKDSKILYNTE